MLLLKIDVIGVITSISTVGATQTVSSSETMKRTVTICVPRLALPYASIVHAAIHYRILCCALTCASLGTFVLQRCSVKCCALGRESHFAEQVHRDGQTSP